MNYKKLGNLDLESSILGLGTMRLPVQDKNPASIDEKKAVELIRYAIDHGINYIDTAYMYHASQSETLVGKALQNGYREKVILADKMPVWYAKEFSDFEKIFTTQLERLDTNYIDLYLLHALDRGVWKFAEKMKAMDYMQALKKDNRIGAIGFSFHGDFELFKDIVDQYDWDFCQIQLNYIDVDYQAGLKGLEYAASKNLPVIIMEPLKGGRLAKNPPPEVDALWQSSNHSFTPAEWALRWLWHFPEVNVVLSGMNTLEDVVENIRIAENANTDQLNKEDLLLVEKAKTTYDSLIKVDCTSCNYCMPCPSKVNIPKCFMFYNEIALYNTPKITKNDYNNFMPKKSRASACIQCGLCETKCPQHLPIMQHLKDVAEYFEKK